MVRGDKTDQAICHIFRHVEGEGALGFAEFVGGGVVVEVVTAVVFRIFHVDGHENVDGVTLHRGVGTYEVESAGEDVVAVGTSLHLLIGGIGHAEELEFDPVVVLGTKIHIVHYIAYIV